MNQTVGRACPQRAESDVAEARRAARRDGLALPGSRGECMATRSTASFEMVLVDGAKRSGTEWVSWEVCIERLSAMALARWELRPTVNGGDTHRLNSPLHAARRKTKLPLVHLIFPGLI